MPAPRAASRRMISWISNLAPTSTPLVGSSSSRTFGDVASHFATTTFCWLPPLSASGGTSTPRRLDPPRVDQRLRLAALARRAHEHVSLDGAIRQDQVVPDRAG